MWSKKLLWLIWKEPRRPRLLLVDIKASTYMLCLLCFCAGLIVKSDETFWFSSRAESYFSNKKFCASYPSNEPRLRRFDDKFSLGRLPMSRCLRGGENEEEGIDEEFLKNMRSLTISRDSGLKNAREEIDRVIEMTVDLKNTLKSVNENLENEESSQDELSGDESSGNLTITEQVQALLNPQGEYDDVFQEEGSELHRDKVLEVMRQFDIKLELKLKDESVMKKLLDINKLFDQTKKEGEELQRQADLLRTMLLRQQCDIEDRVQQMDLYVGASPIQAVDEALYFSTVSEACNQSYYRQTIRILSGQHSVGNSMCNFGLREGGTPIEWPNVMHVPRNWSLSLKGEHASIVDGRMVTMDSSYVQLQDIHIVSQMSKKDSPFWGKNLLTGSEEKQISGVCLLEVLGTVDMKRCNMSINGGACVVCFGDALVNLQSCCLGGFGAEDKGEQIGDDLDESTVVRRFAELMSDSQPQASQGVAAFNKSKISMRNCQIQHVWNGGVSLYQEATGLLDHCRVRGIGYAVGVDDATSAAVTDCCIHIDSNPLLQTGAFYAMPNSSAASLRCEGNEVHGNIWIGDRRPGTISPSISKAGTDDAKLAPARLGRGKARRTELNVKEEVRSEDVWNKAKLDDLLADLDMLKDQLAEAVPNLAQLDRSYNYKSG